MTRTHQGEDGAGWRLALPVAVALAVSAGGAAAQELRWTASTSYATGSYVFDARTHTLALSNGLGLEWDRVGVSASLPLLLQNSRLVSQVGGVPLPTGGEDHGVVGRRQPGQTVGTGRGSGGGGSTTEVAYRDQTELQLGDPFFSAAVRVHEGTGLLRSVQIRGSGKAPLRGLDSGVGTGEWDFGAGASAFASLGTSTYAFVDVSYWWYGDLPELELADGLSYAVGISHSLFRSRGSVLLSFLGAEPVIGTMDRPASLGLGASYGFASGRTLSGGLAVGLSEASPDASVYVGWSMRIG